MKVFLTRRDLYMYGTQMTQRTIARKRALWLSGSSFAATAGMRRDEKKNSPTTSKVADIVNNHQLGESGGTTEEEHKSNCREHYETQISDEIKHQEGRPEWMVGVT